MIDGEAANRPLTPTEQIKVEQNMRLVGKFVSARYRDDWRHDDLVSAGYLGLIHAVKKYDPSVGKFSHYAVRWIRSYVQEEKRRLMFYRVASQHYSEAKSKCFSKEIRDAGQRAIKATKVGWGEVDAAAILAIERVPEITDHEPLYREVDSLSPQQQAVIFTCVQAGRSEYHVAHELGVSQTRVRQVREAAISLLRRRLSRLERLGAI